MIELSLIKHFSVMILKAKIRKRGKKISHKREVKSIIHEIQSKYEIKSIICVHEIQILNMLKNKF